MGFIHARWFESIPTETNNYITIAQGTKAYTTNSLQYINQMRTASVYTPNLKEKSNKKFQYGTTMSVAKTCIQIAVVEGVTSELTGLLTEFILKYCQNTGLNIEAIHSVSQLNNEISQEPFSAAIATICEISNPEYHKPKGRLPKRYKTTEENIRHVSLAFKTCDYCQEKGHNIRGCKQHKADLANKENL
jgi:hypothetical protein